jgi:hypothetical protein
MVKLKSVKSSLARRVCCCCLGPRRRRGGGTDTVAVGGELNEHWADGEEEGPVDRVDVEDDGMRVPSTFPAASDRRDPFEKAVELALIVGDGDIKFVSRNSFRGFLGGLVYSARYPKFYDELRRTTVVGQCIS